LDKTEPQAANDSDYGGGNGCPPDDFCKKLRQQIEALYQKVIRLSMPVPTGDPTGAARQQVIAARRSFNKAVEDYNKVCAKSPAGPLDLKLTVGPQRPSIPGQRLLDDFYGR
jgi:hypothetical protein